MTPQIVVLWSFAIVVLAIAISLSLVVGYITFKILCAIKEKGLQAISDWFAEHS